MHLLPAAYLLLCRQGTGGGEVLLLRRAGIGFADGQLGLIAGKLEPGESASQAAIREVQEECGITVVPENLHFVTAMHRHLGEDEPGWIDVFFAADRWTGDLVNGEPHKCSELVWAPIEDLPADTVDLRARGDRAGFHRLAVLPGARL